MGYRVEQRWRRREQSGARRYGWRLMALTYHAVIIQNRFYSSQVDSNVSYCGKEESEGALMRTLCLYLLRMSLSELFLSNRLSYYLFIYLWLHVPYSELCIGLRAEQKMVKIRKKPIILKRYTSSLKVNVISILPAVCTLIVEWLGVLPSVQSSNACLWIFPV